MGRKLALIIGNSQFDDPGLARLQAPVADVLALAEVLRDPAVASFDDVQTLVNESFGRIRRAIARFFDDRKRDDLLLLYFSGHGVRDEYGHLHLAVRDTERELLAATAIEANFVTACMDRSASKRLVLVLDCCHSGAFAAGSKSVQGASVGTATTFEGNGRGRVVLTATDSTQYAWEGDAIIGTPGASLFTRHLTDGLRTGAADLNHDGMITVDELYDYVYDQVLNDTAKQTPGKWAFGQQGDIVIARTRISGEATGSSAARPLPTGRREWWRPAATLLARRRVAAASAIAGSIVVIGVARFALSPSDSSGREPAASPAVTVVPQPTPGTPPAAVPASGPPAAMQPAPAATTPETGRAPAPTPSAGAARAAPPGRQPAAAATPAPAASSRSATSPLIDLRAVFPPAPFEVANDPPATAAAAESSPGDTPARAPERAPERAAGAERTPRGEDRPAVVPAGRPLNNPIQEYERAAEALDFERLRRIWPEAPEALRRTYQNLRSQSVDLECPDYTFAESSDVTCQERVRSVGAGGITLPAVTNTTVFSLRRSGDGWQISRIRRQPAR